MPVMRVNLPVDEELLRGRECARCKSTKFRAITFTSISPAHCISCLCETSTPANESATTVRLAICCQCDRIGMLV